MCYAASKLKILFYRVQIFRTKCDGHVNPVEPSYTLKFQTFHQNRATSGIRRPKPNAFELIRKMGAA